jgi:hypothetical protein
MDFSKKKVGMLNFVKDDIKLYPELYTNTDSISNIMCKRDIYKGAKIMTISYDKLLSYTYVKKDPFIKELIEKMNSLNKNISRNSLIALYILCEYLSDQSEWEFYFKTLPTDVSHHFLTFSKTELLNFKSSPIMKKNYKVAIGVQLPRSLTYKQLDDSYQADYKTIKKYVSTIHPIFSKIDMDEFERLFRKCRIWVTSRIFGFYYKGFNESAMVAGADLLNHTTNENTSWKFEETLNSFTVTAKKDIPANTIISDTYGKQKNIYTFLLWYGFIEEDVSFINYPLFNGDTFLSELKWPNINLSKVLLDLEKNDISKPRYYLKSLLLRKIKNYTKSLQKSYGKNKFAIKNGKRLYKLEMKVITAYLKALN